MILRGSGRVLLGTTEHEIGVGDVVYVEPHETHQFTSGPDGLGFLCVVPPRGPRS